MKLRFTKMTGLGNDFVMIDAISQRVSITPERVRRLADRHFGIGCDQVLVVEPPVTPDADFCYRIFNSDGSEVENCGNGARCFAIFVRQRKLTGRRDIRVETAGGKLLLHVNPDNQVTVDMGLPRFEPADIPFRATARAPTYPLRVGNTELTISAVSMGNPHAVTIVDDVQRFPVETLGPEIEKHPDFPRRVNAGFMEIVDRHTIRLRVYERGVGETLACGTGACAAATAGIQQGLLDSPVTVHLPGGPLEIQWPSPEQPVLMTGPATTVFHGQIHL